MAYDTTIDNVLGMFAASFNKGAAWREGSRPMWKSAFEHTPDRALTEGVEMVCMQEYSFPPSFGSVVSAVRKKTVDMGFSSTHQVIDYPYCSDHCRAEGGSVLTSALYTWIAPSKEGGRGAGAEPARVQNETYVSVKQNMCGCKGSRQRLGDGLRGWQERRTKLQEDARLDLHEFFYTDTDMPTLTHKETMLPWDWEELDAKVKEGQASDRGFHRHIRLMVEGGAAMGEHLTGKREDPNND